MKYKIVIKTEIRSEPSLERGIIFGILEPGFIVDIVQEIEDPHYQNKWLKDNNGYYYLKEKTEAAFPINTEEIPSLNHAASKIPSWNKGNFDVTRFWPSTTGLGVSVAVIDSGIYPHKDLSKAIDNQKSKFFVGDSIEDTLGHGTHVAGIIAARGVSDMFGVAPECTIVPIKVSNGNQFNNRNLVDAIDYAAKIPEIKIINLSFKANSNDTKGLNQLKSSIKKAINNGKIVVASSGNKSGEKIEAPAEFKNVIAVGAVYIDTKSMKESYLISKSSPYGNSTRSVDISAPGVDIFSCKNEKDGITFNDGTSMAAAYISGIIALKLQKDPDMNAIDILSAFSKSIYQFAHLEGNTSIKIPVLDPNSFINI